MGYKKDAIKGVSWISVLRIATRILTFVRLSILGRILNPTQFGYFGIASLVLALLEILTETGINVFLVQEKKNVKEFVNSAWIVSIIRGIFLCIIILVLSPVIAQFFNADGALAVILLISLVPLIRGFINPAIIIYQKDLLFDKEFKLRSFLFFIDVTVSIVAGLITKSAVSFAYGLIASAIIEVVLSYGLFNIRPKVKFAYKQIKLILKKGGWVTATGVFSYFADNGDNIAVGKLLGSGNLGVYQIAYKLSTLPISEITNVVNQVIFPVYSKLSHDLQRLKNAFIKVTLVNLVSSLILGGAIFLFAEPLLYFIMGSQWSGAVPVVKVLAIYGIFRTIFGSFSALFLSIKKQDYVAKMTFVRVVALIIVIFPLVKQFGMIGAGYAMLFSIITEIPIIVYFTYSVFKNKHK